MGFGIDCAQSGDVSVTQNVAASTAVDAIENRVLIIFVKKTNAESPEKVLIATPLLLTNSLFVSSPVRGHLDITQGSNRLSPMLSP
jgi:hypothetical protein